MSTQPPTPPPAQTPAQTPTQQQIDEAAARVKKALRHSTDAAFKELMKHPATGQQMDYAESRMYFG